MFPRHAVVLWVALAALCGAADPQAQTPAVDGPAVMVRGLQQAASSGSTEAVLALGAAGISRPSFEDFAAALTRPAPSRVAMNERHRTPLETGGQRLVIEVLIERGIQGNLSTWNVDVRPGPTPADPWRISAVSRLSVVTGLYRLSLNPAKEYDIHDLTVHAPDLAIEIPAGHAFVAEVPGGPTAVVLLGRGKMRFTPPDPAERTQLRIFGGAETLTTDIDMAFLRFAPEELSLRLPALSLKQRPSVTPADLRAATTIFNDHIGRSLQIDLGDLSRDRWSLTPAVDDVIAELRTRRFGTLTYARSGSEPEDITLFDRRRRRNISLYASAAKLAQRGRFYSEDDRLDYDVLAYDIDADFNPDRGVIDGRTRIKVRMLADNASSLMLRLAESLSVRGVYSAEFGRLLHLRVVGQNSLIVNLPAQLVRGTEIWLEVVYNGPIAPQAFDREALQIGQESQEPLYIPMEPRYIYSSRSYWYPQSTVTDYATAKLRITVPDGYDVVASGDPAGPPTAPPGDSGSRRRKVYVFDAGKPARYLAVAISRFTTVDRRQIRAGDSNVSLYVQSSPRQAGRVRDMGEKAANVFGFYASLAGDAPYPSFTLALLESDRPGGHSPPYFALVNEVVSSTFVWRSDPVSFANYPTFFLAHEIAHQWWGHAVGSKNYHEQWLSEGFAQYFAALYAEKDLDNVLPNLLRQMRHTAIDASSQGPIYLGYRLGHIQSNDRIFRSLIYNKGAMVLHMLRRLVGDDAFFAGIKSFYSQWKFKKAGTDDFRQVMEKASGRDLNRFFETWIYGATIPHVKFGYHASGEQATLRFEQRGDPVDVPITVTILYASGESTDVVVPLADTLTQRTLPLKGRLKSITANSDNGALVEIEK